MARKEASKFGETGARWALDMVNEEAHTVKLLGGVTPRSADHAKDAIELVFARGGKGGVVVDNEGLERLKNGDRREKEVGSAEYPSRGGIGWVEGAWNEFGKDTVDGEVGICDKGVNMFENEVDGLVSVVANSPAFNDAGVVAVDDDVAVVGYEARDGCNKELKGDGFSPGDVVLAVSCLPAWDEPPGTSTTADDDANANANARASIRERMEVKEQWRGEMAQVTRLEEMVSFHQAGSSWIDFLGRWGMKGFLEQTASMRSKLVKYAWPTGMIIDGAYVFFRLFRG
ncbi:hypothetical protein OG21DRAFT_1525014 [Imleria badia]|nr:hypothetical protein OG21DRAFT_1525014 [Imleria badia]